jgi:glutamate synthase (NADPH/NADH) large chain
VVNFFHFLAEDLREHMAMLGFKTVNEMIGRVDLLEVDPNANHWKLKNLDLSPVLYKPVVPKSVGVYRTVAQDHEIEDVLDKKIIKATQASIKKGEKSQATFDIINTDRSLGAMLSNEITKVHGGKGLPDKTVHIKLNGSAGQSFGAFTTKGVLFELEGEANDYFGKGLSGGELVVYPSKKAKFVAEENSIIGNVAFYGATSGKAFIRGMAGERFCVRNSGVTAVVEGIGDHGCEYMTGGKVVVLGCTGRNFAAGMSGGYAYIWDKTKEFRKKFNDELSDIEALSEGDFKELKTLISEHKTATGSDVAKRILADWETEKIFFKKVMPRDYKKVLEKLKTKTVASKKEAVLK